jgi:DNA-binding NarL/FixJ family response regulator
MAYELGLAENTVKVNAIAILKKLECHSQSSSNAGEGPRTRRRRRRGPEPDQARVATRCQPRVGETQAPLKFGRP